MKVFEAWILPNVFVSTLPQGVAIDTNENGAGLSFLIVYTWHKLYTKYAFMSSFTCFIVLYFIVICTVGYK